MDGWVQLDWDSPVSLSKIDLYGRANNISTRFDDFYLLIYDSSGNEIWSEHLVDIGTDHDFYASIPLPEPMTLGTIGVGGGMLLLRRRRNIRP